MLEALPARLLALAACQTPDLLGAAFCYARLAVRITIRGGKILREADCLLYLLSPCSSHLYSARSSTNTR